MRTHTLLTRAASIAVCFGVLLSGPAMAGGARVIHDVQLTETGQFLGLVKTSAGQNVAGAVVKLKFRGSEIAAAKTNEKGYFAINGVRPGAHELVTGAVHSPVRLWAHGTAPKNARTGLVVAAEETVIRGQDYCETGTCGPGQPTGFGMLDVITLATAGGAITAAVFAIQNDGKIDDLEELVRNGANGGNNPASP